MIESERDQPERVRIPVLIGTVRKGRQSGKVARWMQSILEGAPNVSTELIDLRDLNLVLDDSRRGTADPRFEASVDRADGLVLVVPEYNGSYPGLLKHALDTLLAQYARKSVGLVTVSAGGLGGARLAATMLPVLRDLGLVVIKRDLLVSRAGEAFDEGGELVDGRLPTRADRFVEELLWMKRTLKAGRQPEEV